VQAIGFGFGYVIIRNSWGVDDWGEEGFARVALYPYESEIVFGFTEPSFWISTVRSTWY